MVILAMESCREEGKPLLVVKNPVIHKAVIEKTFVFFLP
jgi:hypothetical protein